MKKMIAILAAVMMVLSMTMVHAELVGGWSVAEDTQVTEERQALFDKAMEGLLGVNYEPVAYLGSQVVAGTNHCFLCKATVVYPDAQPTLTLVYIYEALDGTAQILTIADLSIADLMVIPEE